MGKFNSNNYKGRNNIQKSKNDSTNKMHQNEISCPYNFIPLPDPKTIFNPIWSFETYHDIPFKEGESGQLKFTITAEDLIFIRNGHIGLQDTCLADNYFSHYKDQKNNRKYFIPATSIKGMLRNYIEIVSRANFKLVNDHRYAFRTILRNEFVSDVYKLNTDEIKKNIQCGYLKKQNDKFFIYSCGIPYKIRYNELEKNITNCKFEDHFKPYGKANLKEVFNNRTAKYKYEQDELLKNKGLERKFKLLSNADINYSTWTWKKQPLKYVVFSQDSEDEGESSFYGEIVASGQPFQYGRNNSKEAEYVFKGRKVDVLKEKGKQIKQEVINNFLFINGDNDKERELEDWKYWKDKLNDGIPVFFLLDQNGEVESLGLTLLYKQPYKFSVGDLNRNRSQKPDLAETIFGSVEESNQLKGRVFIGHAHATKVYECPQEISYTLSSPRSSFFPFYLNQDVPIKNYKTYEKRSTLRGYKKYPLREEAKIPPISASQNMVNKMRPLEKNSQFECKIRFYNLLPEEIGALISAIKTHNNQEYYHSLGLGKPFGMGRVKLDNLQLLGLNNDFLYYLDSFEHAITQDENENWLKSESIKEYLAMSTLPNDSTIENKLEYMKVGDFDKIKRNGLALIPYSTLSGFSKALTSVKKSQ